MLVVEASVLVVALADDGADGVVARARLRDEHLSAPELVDLEVASVLWCQVLAGRIGARRAALAMTDLESLPLHRASHRVLVSRCWELRETVSVYDAAYVALAETLGATLLTADARLGRASGPRCPVEVLTPRF